MSRQFLHAYLKAQELHKSIHKLTKAFEEDSTDEQILKRLSDSESLLIEIKLLLANKKGLN